MKVLFEMELHDYGTPIERAKAIIDAVMNHGVACDNYSVENSLRELEEIKEHIEVYLKHVRY